MLVTELFVVGGTVYAGTMAYKKHRKKKKLDPWLYPQKTSKSCTAITTLSLYHDAKTALETVKQDILAPFFGDLRHQQLKEISSDGEDIALSKVEKRVNRDLVISVSTLALTTSGYLFYPPLILASVPGFIFIVGRFYKYASVSLFEERRVRQSTLDAIQITGVIIKGYFFTGACANVFYSVGRKLLNKTEDNARKSLIDVFGEQPRSVWIIMDGAEVEIPFERLQPGDIVVVQAGETLPVDGTIIEGIASIDQHRLTGESQPAEKGVGEKVFAATVALSGKMLIRVEQAGSETVAARIGDLLNRTADSKLAIQSRGEAVTDRLALPTLALSGLALLTVGASGALGILMCPIGYALRVVAPMSLLNFLHITSRNGILIKDGRSLELLKQVDTVVFDKTGTLTLEQPHVSQIYTFNGFSEVEVLTDAATAEYKQTHPIAAAILSVADARELNLPPIEDAHYQVGYGIKVNLPHKIIRVGSDRFMEMEGIAIPVEVSDLQQSCHAQGGSLVIVAINAQLAGAIELHATIRPEARCIISKLQQQNLSLYIISGDQEQPTKRLAEELGIDHYFSNTLPEHKADLVEQLRQEGKSLCFIGDGINDSIALRKADVSVSLRGASTAATDTAQIVLMDSSLTQLAHLFDIAQSFEANMQVNLMTAILPGVICIGGIFFLHFGIFAGLILYNLSLYAGVSNALLAERYLRDEY